MSLFDILYPTSKTTDSNNQYANNPMFASTPVAPVSTVSVNPRFSAPVLADPIPTSPVLADPVLADPTPVAPVLVDSTPVAPVLADPVLVDPVPTNTNPMFADTSAPVDQYENNPMFADTSAPALTEAESENVVEQNNKQSSQNLGLSQENEEVSQAPAEETQSSFTDAEYASFVNEFTPFFRAQLRREPSQADLDYYIKYFYGDKKFDDAEKAELTRAGSVERARDSSFGSEVTDFFLRTVNRPPTSAEIETYRNTYFNPEDSDFGLSQADKEVAKKDLFKERQKAFGLADYQYEGGGTSPGQITKMYQRITGKDPSVDQTTEAYDFFQDVGRYGTDPRRVKATDVQAFKEQVLTPRQLASVPINVAAPAPVLPTNLPIASAPGKTILDDAITGGISGLPQGAPLGPPQPVPLATGGDALMESQALKEMRRVTRARQDLNRIMDQGPL